MKRTALLAAVLMTLGAAPTPAWRQASAGTSPDYFDPLLANPALCAAQTGRPAVLDKLLLAQAETAPFKPTQQARPASAEARPPLYPGLGKLHMKITTGVPAAQNYFDQGLRLLFAFNHAEAARAFRAAQQLDPQCAMCFWGEAYALGPNINAPMFPDAVAPAFAAAQRAQALAANTTPQEQALIRAIGQRYLADAAADRAALDQAYAAAMAEAARRHPTSDTVLVLYAESMMDISPWNYWQAGGAEPREHTAAMVDALERVLERNPTHPGAIHYYIHAVEASTHPEKALPYARQLARQIPGAGHIVHMPSHIYYRVGLYREALDSNIEAMAMDEKYLRQADSDPVYKGAYYPHNIHFAMVSALMGGHGKAALEAGAKLDRAVPNEAVKAFASLQPVKAAPYFSHVQFSSPDVLLSLPDPGPDAVLVKAMWHYARATAYARKALPDQAQQEADAIAALERDADFQPLLAWSVPGKDIVRTARAVAMGRAADARGDLSGAIRYYQEAVAAQDSLPYTEPPYWYYPVRQSLGAALLRAGRLEEAESAFRTSFAKTPSNGWALRGLMEVYRQRGDTAALAATRKRFDTTWLGRKEGPDLAQL